MHVTCEMKACTCIIIVTSIFFPLFFSNSQLLISVLFCRCILDTAGQEWKKQENFLSFLGKGGKQQRKNVLGREEVKMRPECGVRVSKLKETTDQ